MSDFSPSLLTHIICTHAIHTYTTPTYYTVHTRHASILFSIHTLSYCITVSSLDHSPSRFVFHSLFPVRSVRFALILLFFALRLSSLSSCFCRHFWSVLSLSLPLFFPTSSSLLRGIDVVWNIGKAIIQRLEDGRQESGRPGMNLIVFPF